MLAKAIRLTLVLFVLCAYSATVYTFGKNYSSVSSIDSIDMMMEAYSHSSEDVEKIRQGIQHGDSTAALHFPLPGVDCVVYRDDVETESFNAQLAACMQPNILLLEKE